jgi:ubiquinone/menaquinone biosynthesis C-methylase UbiE
MSRNDTIQEIVRHYADADESSRLRTGWFQLEHDRTQELILRHLPPPPATIIDAGGGAGAYACWLAARGYQVHLIDPVPKHVEQARAASSRQAKHPLVSAEVGDARDLPHADASAAAVLLLGPLYHLVEREDRLACLREALRVLRPGGVVWGAAISRFASLLDSLSHGFFDDFVFAPILARDLEEGQHRNSTGNPLYFTDAFFIAPKNSRTNLRAPVFKCWSWWRLKARDGWRAILIACGTTRNSASAYSPQYAKWRPNLRSLARARTSWASHENSAATFLVLYNRRERLRVQRRSAD